MFAINIENFKTLRNPKILYLFKKTLDLSIVCGKCGHEYKKIFTEEKSIEIPKILDLEEEEEEYIYLLKKFTKLVREYHP